MVYWSVHIQLIIYWKINSDIRSAAWPASAYTDDIKYLKEFDLTCDKGQGESRKAEN